MPTENTYKNEDNNVQGNDEKFRKFQNNRMSVASHALLPTICTTLLLKEVTSSSITCSSYHKYIVCTLLSLSLLCGWIKYNLSTVNFNDPTSLSLSYYKSLKRIIGEILDYFDSQKNIENIYVDMLSITFGVSSIYQITANKTTCHVSTIFTTIFCEADSSLSLLVPLLIEVFLSGASCSVKSRSFYMIFSMGLFSMLYSMQLRKVLSFLAFGVVTFILMKEIRRQNIELFKLTESLHQTLEDNEKMAEELRLNEMKMMIGNVAHDLKTVCLVYILLSAIILYSYSKHFCFTAIDSICQYTR